MRTLIIGDVHGCSVELQKMMEDYNNYQGSINNKCRRMDKILKFIYENKWIFKTNKIKLWGYDFRKVLKQKIDEFSTNENYKEGKNNKVFLNHFKHFPRLLFGERLAVGLGRVARFRYYYIYIPVCSMLLC